MTRKLVVVLGLLVSGVVVPATLFSLAGLMIGYSPLTTLALIASKPGIVPLACILYALTQALFITLAMIHTNEEGNR